MSTLSKHTGKYELCWASQHGHIKLVKLLLDEGFRDDWSSWSASNKGHWEVVKLIQKYNKRDKSMKILHKTEIISALERAWHEYYQTNKYQLDKWLIDSIEKEFYEEKLLNLDYDDEIIQEILNDMSY